MVGEAFPPNTGFVQLQTLDHRAHRPVEQQNAFAEQFGDEIGGRIGLKHKNFIAIVWIDSFSAIVVARSKITRRTAKSARGEPGFADSANSPLPLPVEFRYSAKASRQIQANTEAPR